MYLDKQHIKGTNDLEIFEKEKESLKSSCFSLNSSHAFDPLKLEDACTLNLYHIQHSIPACFRDFPIPFEFVKRKTYLISFDFISDSYQYLYRPSSHLDFWSDDTPHHKYTLKYTSLYKVETLKKHSNVFILPKQTGFGLDLSCTDIS
jgi:hypothetical protein